MNSLDNIPQELLTDNRFIKAKSCIESLLKDKGLFHATLCIKREHFPILQKMFPGHLVPMFPSLEEHFLGETTTEKEQELLLNMQNDLCEPHDIMVSFRL